MNKHKLQSPTLSFIYIGIKRILKCHPVKCLGGGSGLDFVPKKKYHILKDPKNLEHVTNIFFSQRRKMIKKPLKFLFKNFDKISEELSIDLNIRPQNLDHKTYYKICELYENQSIK